MDSVVSPTRTVAQRLNQSLDVRASAARQDEDVAAGETTIRSLAPTVAMRAVVGDADHMRRIPLADVAPGHHHLTSFRLSVDSSVL